LVALRDREGGAKGEQVFVVLGENAKKRRKGRERRSRIADNDTGHDTGNGARLRNIFAPERQNQSEGGNLERNKKSLVKAGRHES
jgi:hypothetical protein